MVGILLTTIVCLVLLCAVLVAITVRSVRVADQLAQVRDRQSIRIRHYRGQAAQLRAQLRCARVAEAALTPDACTDPLEALYAAPAYNPEDHR